jgi:hypothetical protein
MRPDLFSVKFLDELLGLLNGFYLDNAGLFRERLCAASDDFDKRDIPAWQAECLKLLRGKCGRQALQDK